MFTSIPFGLSVYLCLWVFALGVCGVLMVSRQAAFDVFTREFWRFLLEPWKIVTFLIATGLLVLAAPYSGDPTWDTADSVIIGWMTYVTAPWSMGILYQAGLGKRSLKEAFVAFCFFWVPCWTYDLYILLTMRMYPPTWWSNLIISGMICFTAGLFWNLAWTEQGKAHFAFSRDEWPGVPPTPFIRIFPYAALLAFPVLFTIGWFVWNFTFR